MMHFCLDQCGECPANPYPIISAVRFGSKQALNKITRLISSILMHRMECEANKIRCGSSRCDVRSPN